jgi:uncharacterized membrane protein HdeD (DUF308 family)
MDYDFNKTARWTFYTAGVIFVLLGILLLIFPLFVIASTAVFMGVGFLLAGVNNLVPYYSMRKNPMRPKWFLLLGAVDLVFGLLFLSNIGLAIFAVTTLLGAWVMAVGCLRVYMSFQAKAYGARKWWVMLLSAAMMLLISAALLSNPLVGAVSIGLLTGLSFITVGVIIISEGRLIYPGSFVNPPRAS